MFVLGILKSQVMYSDLDDVSYCTAVITCSIFSKVFTLDSP